MEYSAQLHEDFPSRNEIDKLSIEEMHKMTLEAPYGYFRLTSSLSNYFFERLDEQMTPKMWKEFDKAVKKLIKENKDGLHKRTN